MNARVLARDPAELLQNVEFLWVTGALVATLLVGAFVLSWVERWRKRQLSNSPASEVEQLSSYRTMFENGELSKEEYDRIKAKEANRLHEKVAQQAPVPISPARELPVNCRPQEPETPPP